MICQMCTEMADGVFQPLAQWELEVLQEKESDANRHQCKDRGCTCQHREVK